MTLATSVVAAPAAVTSASQWPARLLLQFSRRAQGVVLSRCRHSGPLYVQKPFYPEGRALAHVYLLHPPGGLVSGDVLEQRVEVDADAAALITTPGAARVYRARTEAPLQRQRIDLRLGERATLEWLPLETIVYDGACVELDTQIALSAGSRVCAWEVTCFGLPASGRAFMRGSFRQRYRVTVEGVPQFIDQLLIDERNRAAMLQGPAGLRGHPVSGFLIAGPLDAEQSVAALEALQALDCAGDGAVTQLGVFIVVRYLGDSSAQARAFLTACWQCLRPWVIGRPACAPRIWST